MGRITHLLVFFFSVAMTVSTQDAVTIANQLHKKTVTIDTHVDTPMLLLGDGFDVGKRNEPPHSPY